MNIEGFIQYVSICICQYLDESFCLLNSHEKQADSSCQAVYMDKVKRHTYVQVVSCQSTGIGSTPRKGVSLSVLLMEGVLCSAHITVMSCQTLHKGEPTNPAHDISYSLPCFLSLISSFPWILLLRNVKGHCSFFVWIGACPYSCMMVLPSLVTTYLDAMDGGESWAGRRNCVSCHIGVVFVVDGEFNVNLSTTMCTFLLPRGCFAVKVVGWGTCWCPGHSDCTYL